MIEVKRKAAEKGRTFQFTDKFVDALKATDKRQTIREARGFALQVMAAGKRSSTPTKRWLYLYTWDGKQAELTLGTYPTMKLETARTEYGKAYAKVVLGIDPKAPEVVVATPDEELTFGWFVKEYNKYARANYTQDWADTVEMSLKLDALPAWEDTPLVKIRRREIIKLMEDVSDRAPGQARNLYKSVRGVFSWAMGRDYINGNPVFKISTQVPKLKPVRRKRMLTPKEIKTVWAGLSVGSERSQRTRDAIKLELVLMQRGIEVTSMHRDQIDGAWWTIEDTKNELTHRVYLTETALALIGDADGWIFPSAKKDKKGVPLGHKSRQTLSQHVATHGYYGIPQWQPHDLRRTGRTGLSRLRVNREHAEAVVNHKKQGMDEIYNLHEYDAEKVEAMMDWEAELLSIIA